MNSSDPITVLLAEDHMIVRAGLRAILEAEDDIEVVGEAQDGRQAIALAKELLPSVIVMDLAMPQLNGLEATRQILKAAPATRILIFSAYSDDAYVEKVMGLGAAGYLIKQTSLVILAKAIREVSKTNTFFSPSSAKRLCDQDYWSRDRVGLHSKKIAQLTSHEIDLLQLLADGKANKEAASGLRISIKTVEKYRQALMEKLNIHDIASLTRYAIAVGIVKSSIQLTLV